MTGRQMTKQPAEKGKEPKSGAAPKAGGQPKAAAEPKGAAQPKAGAESKAGAERKAGSPTEAHGAKGGGVSAAGATVARLQTLYREKAVPDLMKQFSYATTMQVPRIAKITLNMGVGEAVADKKNIDAAVADLTRIAGQKPVVTRARKAIANFKIRQGLPIGCMVTLRGSRMYEFLDRLITIAFPRMRDFRGVSVRAFDGRGNYSIGFKEQIIFPEIEYDKIDKVRGLNVSITTTARSDEEAKALLAAFRFPFRN
jgi:large subunit ribosomal protein L5